MRTRTAFIGSVVALSGIALTAVLVPQEVTKGLVHEISRGAPVSEEAHAQIVFEDADGIPKDAEIVELDDEQLRAMMLEVDASAGQSGRATDLGAMDVVQDAVRADPESPFIGSWMQESRAGEMLIRIRLSLESDGRYTGEAELFPHDAPADAAPVRTISTAGIWEERGGNIVLSRMESDAPEVLPMGWREVYWDSNAEGRDWSYTDADGIERVLVRVRA